jgi:hypothetical protein
VVAGSRPTSFFAHHLVAVDPKDPTAGTEAVEPGEIAITADDPIHMASSRTAVRVKGPSVNQKTDKVG